MEAITDQLELLRSNLAHHTYPNYPPFEDRLVFEQETLQIEDGRLVIPDGPWLVDDYPNQREPEHTPNPVLRHALAAEGIRLDSIGRPLHPWLGQMALDASIGIVAGKGAYWNWGPNYTADPIIIQNGHVVLVERNDTGLWSLPGGHVDPGENTATAAKREAEEETGLIIPSYVEETVTYRGPVVDLRVTAHAWPETTAILYELPDNPTLPPLRPQVSENTRAEWKSLEEIEQHTVLFGSHQFLLKSALKYLKSPR